MSIRLLAKDLYRLHQEVERLETELASAPLGKQEAIQIKLRQTRAERDRLRATLDGRKDSPRQSR
jgi:hypothetical protein